MLHTCTAKVPGSVLHVLNNLFYVEVNTFIFTFIILNFWIICNKGHKNAPTCFTICASNMENHIYNSMKFGTCWHIPVLVKTGQL
jgi:hypothetical protein